MKTLTPLAVLALLSASSPTYGQQRQILENRGIVVRVETTLKQHVPVQTVLIRGDHGWTPALFTDTSVTRIVAGSQHEAQACTVSSLEGANGRTRIALHLECPAGRLDRTISISAEPGVVLVNVRFTPISTMPVFSVEDRYYFAPERRPTDTLTSGPLDFVWSQNLKSEPDDLIPYWCFKSPAVMLQQGKVFAAIMPVLSNRVSVPLAFDLDVTGEKTPWFSFGAVSAEPHGHSYFRRAKNVRISSGVIEYSYAIVASSESERLGYRRVVRRIWKTLGHPQLLNATDLQRNVRRPDLVLFDDWRKEAWIRYAGEVYRAVDCPGAGCGTLASNRNYMGQWDKPEGDAWFNAWFQTLRTAYGWYLYGKRTNNREIERRAESVLTLALRSPQQDGVFATIYLLPEHKWIREDGWAGFSEDFHSFCMSWTAYWMLKWAEDLVPSRKDEVISFTRGYGDFLVKHQQQSGVIPSWYDSQLNPREEFQTLNAETAGSALFLLEMAEFTGDHTYLEAGTRAMKFITQQVLPRQLWWDFETYKSCARKSFDFYDRITAQYPQNNLSTMQATMAYLKLYRITKERQWLDLGTEVLDYLLLTQQVWNNPAFDSNLVGGFTTQNTDAEWSDARQAYAAVLLWDYYRETEQVEYLERAVAAARATFAVAPWENWAHTGYKNEPGAMTGFHWGTGSAMTSVELLSSALGDAFINISRRHGVGFNAVSLDNLSVKGSTISFELKAVPELRTALIKFVGADPRANYRLVCNGSRSVTVKGDELMTGHRFTIQTHR